MLSRREEIEAKRQKLQALRQQRQQRELKEKTRSFSGAGRRTVSGQRVDEIVDEITKSPQSPRLSKSREQLQHSVQHEAIDLRDSSADKIEVSEDANQTIESITDSSPKYVEIGVETNRITTQKEQILYEKGVETNDFKILKDLEHESIKKDLEKQLRKEIEEYYREQSVSNKAVIADADKLTPEDLAALDSDSDDEFLKVAHSAAKLENAQNEEKQKEEEDKLSKFLESSFKIINRAVSEDQKSLLQIFGDPEKTSQCLGKDFESVVSANDFVSEKLKVTQTHSFSDETVEGKSVTSMDWCKEHIAVAYSNKPKNDKNSYTEFNESVIKIWNTNFKFSVPEIELRCNAATEIVCVTFNKQNPNLLYAGGYNGKIYTFDINVSRLPISVSASYGNDVQGHLHPVYSIVHKVDLQIATNGYLVSCSTDGTICLWSPFSVKEPLGVPTHLKSPTGLLSKYDELAPTSMEICNGKELIIGTEDGKIYNVEGWDLQTKKGEIKFKSIFKGHTYSPVLGLSGLKPSKYNQKLPELNNLFLSCGFDWNIKLWSLADQRSILDSKTIDENIGLVEPIMEFNDKDAVADLAWRPNKMGQFVSVGASGFAQIWDIVENIVSPIVKVCPISDTQKTEFVQTQNTGVSESALVKIRFNEEGDKFAVGGIDGFCNVFKLEDIKYDEEQSLRKMASLLK